MSDRGAVPGTGGEAERDEARREGEARFRTLADPIAQLAWMADASGWIFWYNLVALTGWAQDSDRERTRDAGFDHHLVKPVDLKSPEALLEELGS